MNSTFDPRAFIHENDRKALDALKAIPGFSEATKAVMRIYSEHTMRILNMSSKVRLSSEQFPRIYRLLPPICEAFRIDVPELYLEMDRTPNAYTSGDTNVFITLTSGLLEMMNDDEIQAVLAHECGHIVCRHVLYQTMGRLILSGAASLLPLGGLISAALSTAFAYWMRCSEFSADRASAAFLGGPERVVDVMLRLAGCSADMAGEVSAELFMRQAADYKQYVDSSTWNKVLESLVLANQSHPFLAVRAASISEWCSSAGFTAIHPAAQAGDGSALHCPKCGAPVQSDWSFCRNCGTKL